MYSFKCLNIYQCVNWSEEADNGNMPDREDDLFQANKGTHAILVLMVMMMILMMLILMMILMMIMMVMILMMIMIIRMIAILLLVLLMVLTFLVPCSYII